VLPLFALFYDSKASIIYRHALVLTAEISKNAV